MILAPLQIVAEQQIERARRRLRILGHDFDETARFGVHRREPHHFGVVLAETPLFEITCGEKTWFAYTDKEKNDIVKTLEGKRYKVDRSKGLGENDPEMMWLTTMNPETRRLIKVMPEDAEATAQVFDLLLGDNLQGRKDHIAENGYKYLELADIS